MKYTDNIYTTINPFEILEQEQKKVDYKLDFKLIDYEILCKNLKNGNNKVFPRQELKVFNLDDYYVNEYDVFISNFKIKLIKKKFKNKFDIKLKFDKNLMTLQAEIILQEDFVFYNNFKSDLLQEICKAMIKENILLMRFSANFTKNIDAFVLSLENNKDVKNYVLNVVFGAKIINHEEAELIFHEKLTNVEENNLDDNIIEANSLLFEYIFEKKGRDGRDIKGNICICNKSINSKNIFISHDESIIEKKFEEKIKYYSAYRGFLTFKDDIYSIKFFDQNNKLNDLDEKSEINNIETSLSIIDSVGPTIINAKSIIIKEQTHLKSKIYAKNAYINIHKGYIKADTVYIENLENGVVVAKNVYVKNCIGSKIEADNIYIENIHSNNKFYPKVNFVVANTFKGGGGKFNIC